MKKFVLSLVCLSFLIPSISYSTSWDTYYNECKNGVSGVYALFDKQCNWKPMSCKDYANWKYNWKSWKTGSSFPKWAIKDYGHCPDGSYIESTWPSMIKRGTGKGTPANDPSNTVSRNPSPSVQPAQPHYRTSQENYERQLDNAKYRASVKMSDYIDASIRSYLDWAKNSGNPIAWQQSLKVDMNYNEYSACLKDVLSGVLTEYEGTRAGDLPFNRYRKFIDSNFVIALQDCDDLINN